MSLHDVLWIEEKVKAFCEEEGIQCKDTKFHAVGLESMTGPEPIIRLLFADEGLKDFGVVIPQDTAKYAEMSRAIKYYMKKHNFEPKHLIRCLYTDVMLPPERYI